MYPPAIWVLEILLAAFPVTVRIISSLLDKTFTLDKTLGGFEIFVFSLVLLVTTFPALIESTKFDPKNARDAYNIVTFMLSLLIVAVLNWVSANNKEGISWLIGAGLALFSIIYCTVIRRNYKWH